MFALVVKNHLQMTRKFYLFLALFFINISGAQAQFVHPGLSHKLSDLDRMKHMVEAGIEPFASSFELLASNRRASFDYEVADGMTGMTNLTPTLNRFLVNDGIAAYYNSLMWYITGDSRHAEKAIEVFSVWSDLRRMDANFALDGGRHWKLIEAAEIIKSTYSGWDPDDLQKFKDMLVYPGWSGTDAPTAALNSDDHTLYWTVYQGDPARHGNQGIFGMRVMMAMGIFLDNEIMYDRALRYLQGLPHRSDDLPYPSGPPRVSGPINRYEHYDEFSLDGFEDTIEDYGYNEVISNYIYENGQGQESSRDQAHALGGTSTLATMAEIAWNQGDDLYGHLDNRILTGLSFWYRYNVSWVRSFADQPTPWEPTVESGEYIERSDRSGRWKALKINPYLTFNIGEEFRHRGRTDLLTEPVLESNLGHYKFRMGLPAEDTKWLERGFDFLTDEIGIEQLTTTDHPGLGGLKYRRVSPGDPISGFAANGNPNYAMNEIPLVIEAENFDFFTVSGEGRTYNDTSAGNSEGAYRTDENVDIEPRTGGGFNVTSIDSGEWLTFTVSVPETDNYDIAVNYAATSSNGEINFEFSGSDATGEVALFSTGGAQVWEDVTVAQGVTLTQGVHSMKVRFGGSSGSFNLNSITINESGAAPIEPGPDPVIPDPQPPEPVIPDPQPPEPVIPDPENSLPVVSFASPAAGATFEADSLISVMVNATDSDGTVANVRLSVNGDFIRQENADPYQWGAGDSILQNLGAGTHQLTAVATDNSGESTEESISITIIESADPVQPGPVPPEPVPPTEVPAPSADGKDFRLVKRNATDFVIDGGSGAVAGRSVELYSNLDHDNLTWTEIDLGNGYVAYQKFDTTVCMDGGSGGANNQDVTLDNCNSSDINQQWLKINVGSGHYLLQKRGTRLALDAGDGGATDQNVFLSNTNGANQNQHWRFDAR